MRATVITDASFCPDTRAGGWAVWVSYDGGPFKKSGRFRRRCKDSLEAEYHAALNGIWIAQKLGAVNILVQTDCMAVVTRIQNGKRKELRQFTGCTLRARHVKGHTNHKEPRYYVNRWCDAQAGQHMRKQRKELEQTACNPSRPLYTA